MAEINEKYVVKEVKIQVPWGEIALKCWNLAELPAVLVVHGLCENAGSFDRLIPLLSRQFFYVVIDLPGHGWVNFIFLILGTLKTIFHRCLPSTINSSLIFLHKLLLLALQPVVLTFPYWVSFRRSSRFPQGLPLDFMVYVGQLERVITHFKWKKLSLMGHSLGAHILEFFAATYTNKVFPNLLIFFMFRQFD